MKQFYTVLSLLCISFSFPFLIEMYSQKSKTFKDPLRFESKIINIGKIKSDTTVSVNFNFKNTGNEIIKINNIDKSCMCTNIIISKEDKKYNLKKNNGKTVIKFKPGEEGKVTMTVDLHNKTNKFSIWGVIIANTQQKYYKTTLQGHVIENNN